jgi:parallel beta-helix repeat protein
VGVSYSDNNIISGNLISSNNGSGVDIYSSNNNEVSSNTITSNQIFGILFSGFNNALFGNTISSNNGTGILLYQSLLSTIENNIISNNTDGILLSYSLLNSIRKNNILGNKRDAFYAHEFPIVDLRTNRWRQNYWGQPQTRPKIISGELLIRYRQGPGYKYHHVPWIPQIDWRPAQEPYDIEV